MKKLVIAGVLAVIVAAPAFAQTLERSVADRTLPYAVHPGDRDGAKTDLRRVGPLLGRDAAEVAGQVVAWLSAR